ncbi:hypothetical protein [Arthrobacter sp. 7Tela_A1]|uniref:hypothetical protein n=1 Tax=Arthrobacter sp. 7Tela_A1 TaxID=3093745 RepID=UPI003BB79296
MSHTARQGPVGGSTPTTRAAGLLPRAAGLAWCALILWLVLSNLVVPSYGYSRYETWAAVLAGAAVLVAAAGCPWLLARLDAALSSVRWLRIPAALLGWAAVFAVSARVADAVRLPPDWDAAAIYYSGTAVSEGIPEAADRDYFAVNPNNLLLMLLLGKYLAAAESSGAVDLRQSVAYLNAAVLFAGMLLTYACGLLFGGKQVARLTLVPSFILIALSPWLPVFYSDTAGLLFPILILCLVGLAERSRLPVRLLLWAAAGAAAAVGYGIKPPVLIALAGAVLVLLLSIRRSNWRQDLLAGTAAAALAAAAFAGTSAAVDNWKVASGFPAAGTADSQALPFTHFLKVGAQQYPGPHGDYYGAYNEDDRTTTLAVQDPQERFNAGLEAYAERVESMGPVGYAGFLNAKLRWITGDGSFFSWGEGSMDANAFLAGDGFSRWVQDFYGPGRPGFGFLLSVWQGTWFLLLGLCGAALFLRTERLQALGPVIARLCLLGLLVFLMFSEGRARFLYLYVPYFIVLGSLSLQAAGELAGRTWRRRARRAPADPSPEMVE